MRFAVTVLLWVPMLAIAVDVLPGEERVQYAAIAGIPLPAQAPDRPDGEGEGPFSRLVITNVMLVDGLGSPPRGPVSIVIENDRIASIGSAKPRDSDELLDGTGMTALPGFVDAHAHIGNPGQGLAGPITPPEYVFKLWLAHGVTTVRPVTLLNRPAEPHH